MITLFLLFSGFILVGTVFTVFAKILIFLLTLFFEILAFVLSISVIGVVGFAIFLIIDLAVFSLLKKII